MSRPRVVVAGLGDSGLLTSIRLARSAEVTGISVKPALVSGQELGVRLTRPADWARDYLVPFDRYRALDRVRTVHAELTGVDTAARTVRARRSDGVEFTEPYDALVISTGVSNGFWRRPGLQTAAEIHAEITEAHRRLAAARSVMVIGGGAAAVSAAANIYRPPQRRWGSVIGVQPDGWEIFAPDGRPFRIPAWPVHRMLIPLVVRRGIYRGIRDNQPLGPPLDG